jgi:argininosuccinate lyase
MSRLWDKGLPLDELVHRFTVGDDPVTDLALVPFDCAASAAHARMLEEAGLLPAGDGARIARALAGLRVQALAGEFTITAAQEDGHTAIEEALTLELGETGKRVHLARSRNDQVITAMRLYLRDAVFALAAATAPLAASFVREAKAHADVPMPGYTHLRRGMPSTGGLWLTAFAEGLTEELAALAALDDRFDRSPLGSAAGFGVPLPIRRERVAELLGFARVQQAVVDVQNSRGRYELALASWASGVLNLLEKFLWDLSLYTTDEFGFIKLPLAFTTGSSIMPQKRNPDVVELARARCREMRGLRSQIEQIATGLPSNYHRDFQLLKKPTMQVVRVTLDVLDVTRRVLDGLEWNEAALAAACTDEIYSAHEAYRLAGQGMAFRDAYKVVGGALIAGTFAPDRAALTASHIGGAADLGLEATEAELAALDQRFATRRAAFDAALENVFGV